MKSSNVNDYFPISRDSWDAYLKARNNFFYYFNDFFNAWTECHSAFEQEVSKTQFIQDTKLEMI